MAYTEIEPTAAGTPSNLGNYTFNCEFHDSGSAGTMARASMTKDGQTVYKSVSIPNTAQIQGYTIEANESEATVYAVIKKQSSEGGHESGLDTSPIPNPVSIGGECNRIRADTNEQWIDTFYGATYAFWTGRWYQAMCIVAATSPITVVYNHHIWMRDGEIVSEHDTTVSLNQSFTYDGKTVYYTDPYFAFDDTTIYSGMTGAVAASAQAVANTAWTMVYGTYVGPDEYEEKLVGRFKIDLEDAGGYPGGGGDWIDPGDWNEDPYTTLHVEVNGALSGRHNDPIYDTSYSYVPSDKATVKQYGCGGDGGHGGGGGAGASTVVIHRIATNKANNHEATAIAKRHGYGSGGGKGGKGGDGCILVYY